MTGTEYRRLTLAQMQTRSWRLAREIQNGYAAIAAGTAVEIIGKHGGLRLRTPRCPCCGVRLFITRVLPSDVEEIR
jgi:hypothetical protein